MEFNLGTQFSREFDFEETSLITDSLTKILNESFAKKEYSLKVKKIYVGFICVSKGFEPYFMARPLKILKKKLAIEYEIKLDFEEVFKSNTENKIRILYNELINQSRIILNDKKLVDFKVQDFLDDLEISLNTLV
jgi:hypothetical protein